MIRMFRFAFLIPAVFLTACSGVLIVDSRAPCIDCSETPVDLVVVARPSPCNDYPVTYRAQSSTKLDPPRPVDTSVANLKGKAARSADCSL